MATTVSASNTQASLSSSSNSNKTLNGSNKGILRTATKNTLLTQPAPPSPLLKRAMGRALERTISVHTSMGKPVGKRSIALAPSGPSSSARRIAVKPLPEVSSPNLKKSNAAYGRTTSILVINTPADPTSTTEGATLPTASEETRPDMLRRRSSRFDKSVGFDLTNREILKARKLAQKGFEDKTGKSWTLTRNKSQLDIDIYEQEVRKHEARMVSKKQEEVDREMEIQKSIESRQDQINQLQRRVAEKETELIANKSIAEQAKTDIQNAIKDQIMKGSAITDEKSSDVRMRVEQQKKALKKQMINETALDDPRRRVLETQKEVEELRVIINLLKKEIAKIKHDASFEKSSKARMKAAKKAKEDERASGIVKEYKPIKQKVAKPVVQKSHMARMEAEKQRKSSKKTNSNVTALRSSGGLRESLTLRMRRSGMIRQSSGLRGTGTIKRDLGSSSTSSSSSSKATVVIAQ